MGINRDKVQAAASKLLQSGKYEKAIAEYRKLVDDDPNDVRTFLKIGDTYVKMGKKADAIRTYGQVAAIYSQQGFHLKAVAVYKQMLRVDSSQTDVHFQLAELYQQMGLSSDSLQHFQHVATQYEQAGRGKDSLAVLKRMVQLDPDNLPSRIKLAELFAQHEMLDDAVNELRSAANYLLERQRQDDFTRVAERLLFFAPGDLEITHVLARQYLSAGDAKAALGKLQICFKSDARNLDTLELIAQAFLDMQQTVKTVSVYKEIARIHHANGNAGQAIAAWQRVLALVPNDPDALQGVSAAQGAPAPAVAAAIAAGTAVEAPVPASASQVLVPPPPAPAAKPPAEIAAAPPVEASTTGQGAVAIATGASATPAPSPQVSNASVRPASAPAAPLQEETASLLNETQVFMKYGLHGKALEGIEKAIALQPGHIELHITKRDVHEALNQNDAALAELRVLVQLGRAQGDPRTGGWEAALGGADAQASVEAESVVEDDIVLLSDDGQLSIDDDDDDDDDDVVLEADDLLEIVDDEIGDGSAFTAEYALEMNPEELIASVDDSAEIGPEDLLPSNMNFDDDSDEGLSLADADALVAEAMASFSDEEVVAEDPPFEAESTTAALDVHEEVVWSEESAPVAQQPVKPSVSVAKTLVTMPSFDDAALAAAQAKAASPAPPKNTYRPPAEPAQTQVTMPAFEMNAAQQAAGDANAAARPGYSPDNDPAAEAFADELEEAEFFIQQEMADEAREILDSILAKVPDSYRAEWMLRRIEAIEKGEPPPPAPWEQRIIDDVEAEMAAEPTASFAVPSEEQISVESVIHQFKRGVAETVSEDDAETHYNLGIAYREMGLYSDAITEFRLSLRSPSMACDANHLIGLTLADLGNYNEALQAFDAALSTPAATTKQKGFNQYQRGICLEAMGQSRDALSAFQQSKMLGADMADLEQRITQLRKTL